MGRIIRTKQGLQTSNTTQTRVYTHFPTIRCALEIVKKKKEVIKILNKL